MAKLEIISKVRVVPNGYDKHSSFGNFEKGCYHRVRHESIYNKSKMTFGIFIPSSYENNCCRNIPALFWLSGMTCDDTNFAMKAGQKAFQAAERHVSNQSLLPVASVSCSSFLLFNSSLGLIYISCFLQF